MAMATTTTMAGPSSLSSLCSISGRTAPPSQVPSATSFRPTRRTAAGRVRAQRAGGDPESKQLLDAFFLGRALAETVTERFGNLVGEILSEVGQRQAESQRHIREFQNEVQERAKTSAQRAAQKALATEQPSAPVTRSSALSTVTYDDDDKEPNGASTAGTTKGARVTESTTSAAEGDNGLPSLPYKDLDSLDSLPSDQGTPDF